MFAFTFLAINSIARRQVISFNDHPTEKNERCSFYHIFFIMIDDDSSEAKNKWLLSILGRKRRKRMIILQSIINEKTHDENWNFRWWVASRNTVLLKHFKIEKKMIIFC